MIVIMHKLNTIWFLTWLLPVMICPAAFCHRILFIPTHNAVSHAKSMYLPGEVLKRAGHDVFVLQLIADRRQLIRNKIGITDLIIETESLVDVAKVGSRLTWSSRPSQSELVKIAWRFTTKVCANVLSGDATQQQLSTILSERWDAVFVDDFAACGISALTNELLNKSVVIADYKLVIPPSFKPRGAVVPVGTGNFEDERSWFLYRLGTTLHGLHLAATLKYIDYMVSSMHRGLRKFATSVIDDRRTLEVAAMPDGLDLVQPRALDNAEFDVDCAKGGGGDRVLPEPFRSFVEDPKSRGTIVFALGHYADWNNAPWSAIDSFILAFARLHEYRIIWQWTAKFNLKNVTSNVLVQSWIPQMDILTHPKTKVFISHMGIKSTREAVCARVPVVAFPLFADQFRNAIIASQRGFGVYLDKTNLSAENVYERIKRVLDDPSYANAARRLQDHLDDKIRNSSSLFTFYLDYFIRRNDERILTKYIRPKWRSGGIHWDLHSVIISLVYSTVFLLVGACLVM